VKNSLVATGLILFALFAVGQQNGNSDDFHWDSHKWQELSWKQSVSRLRLAPALKDDIVETIVEQMQEDESDDDAQPEKDLRQIAGETRIAFVDLTGRGRNEVIAQAGGEKSGCSPTGNCLLWVLQRQRDGYHVILDAGSVQIFTIQPTRAHGFNDLVLGMHGGAFDSMLTVYKFNGAQYSNVACYDANSGVVDEHGEVHQFKEPRLTPCQ
jgi:hypothetical protein